jgi:hypothetical protein
MTHLGHGVMSPALRAEPVGTRKEIRLENRLQDQLETTLDHAPDPAAREYRADDVSSFPASGSFAPAPGSGGNRGPSPQPAAPRGMPRPHTRPPPGRRSARPPRPYVLPCYPAHDPRPPAGNPGRRQGCTDHRTGDQDRRSPTGAAWSGSPVPVAQPDTADALVHRYSPMASRHSSILPADLLALFAKYEAFLRSDYYRASVPSTALSRRRACPWPGWIPRR